MVSPLLVVSIFLGMQATAEATAPQAQAQDKRSFTVDRVPNGNFAGLNGPKELYKTYRKFGMPVPDGLTRKLHAEEAVRNINRRSGRQPHHRRNRMQAAGSGGINKAGSSFGHPVNHPVNHAFNHVVTNGTKGTNQSGSVPATPEQGDRAYLCPVKIGGQTLNLDFDTGSSDLWVFGPKVPASESQGHAVYDPSKSDTWSAIDGATWQISYGDGSSASGDVGTDVVDVGGAVFDKQAVEVADTVADSFASDTANDGLLGLGFSSINTVQPEQQKTFFDNILPSLAEPVFTANLKHGTVGSYSFGTVDKSQYSGDLTYVPIDKSQGWWQFTSGGGAAIADTGTTLLLAAESIVDAYYQKVDGAKLDQTQGGYVFPCDAQLPDLDLEIGDSYVAKIPGDLVNLAPLTQGGSTCFGGLQVTTQEELGVYGDILFKGQFVVFDGGKEQLGFAPHA